MRRNNSRIKSAKAFGSLKLFALKVIVQLLERSKEVKCERRIRRGHARKHTHTLIYYTIIHIYTHTHIRVRY